MAGDPTLGGPMGHGAVAAALGRIKPTIGSWRGLRTPC